MKLRTKYGSTGPVVALTLSMLCAGCAGDGDSGRPSLDGAWSSFEGGDWTAAEEDFLSAVDADPRHAEAWCGLGWTRAMLHVDPDDPADYREAVLADFREADLLQADYADAWAGLANFHSHENDTLLAVEWSLDLIDLRGDDYVFAHRAEVNSRSIRRIAAWNLVKLDRLLEALAQVQAVFPEFDPDTEADDFLELLLLKIGEM